MAGIISKYRDKANANLLEIVCDSEQELMDTAPTTDKKGTGDFAFYNGYAPLGSTAIVDAGSKVSIYILFSSGWKKIS